MKLIVSSHSIVIFVFSSALNYVDNLKSCDSYFEANSLFVENWCFGFFLIFIFIYPSSELDDVVAANKH